MEGSKNDKPWTVFSNKPLVWLARIAWLVAPFTVGNALAETLADESTLMQQVTSIGLWLTWLIALTALLLPSTVSLTISRIVVPGAMLVSALAWLHGGVSTAGLVVAAASSLTATLAVLSADVGQEFIQGSAYGDETRFPLRPPGPLVLGLLPIAWLITALLAIAGVLVFGADLWLWGVALSAAAAVVVVGFARRCHRLSRRFAVFVPSGFVLHDHVGLADTAMFTKKSIASFTLARSDTQAADLTASALGPAVELQLKAFTTVVKAGTFKQPGGTGLHVQAVMFSPSRPGRVLAAAAERGLRT